MKTSIAIIFGILSLLAVVFIYEDAFTQQEEEMAEEKPYQKQLGVTDVAPHIPQRPDPEYYEANREEVDNMFLDWIDQYPEEFEAAKQIDLGLNMYNYIVEHGMIELNDPSQYNPTFVLYPVNETKPSYIDLGFPDYDQRVFDRKLEHWYFKFDKEGYVQKYGELPVVSNDRGPYPVNHPDDFDPSIPWEKAHYPEFYN